jgi:hypothetical protein
MKDLERYTLIMFCTFMNFAFLSKIIRTHKNKGRGGNKEREITE